MAPETKRSPIGAELNRTAELEEGRLVTANSRPTVDAAYWRGRLTEAIATYKVPGATMGILHDGQIVDVAAGVLNKATLVEATPDSVFQIGSISKVWTTTMVMQ